MKVNYVIFFWLLNFLATAQQWEWAFSEKAASMAVDGSGNLLLLQDSVIKKYSPQGTLLWQKKISGNIQKLVISEGDKDNFYVGAIYASLTFEKLHLLSNSAYSFFLGKIDASGNLVWYRTYGTADGYELGLHYAKSEKIYMCGRLAANSQLGDSTYAAPGFFFIGTDLSGNITTQRKYSGASGWEMATDSLGYLYVLGGGGDGDSIQFENGLHQRGYFPGFHFVVKYNANGTLVWARDFGQNYYAPHKNLAVEGSGKFYLSKWQRYDGFDISRFDSTGNELWTRNFDSVYGDCSSLFIDEENKVWITGDLFNGYEAYRQAWLWRIDSTGATLDSALETHTTASQCIKGNGNDFYICGNFNTQEHFGSITLNGGSQTPFLAKLHGSVLTSVKNEITLSTIEIFPNPATDHFMVRLPASTIQAELRMFDIEGKCCYSTTLKEGQCSVDVSGRTPGTYIIEIQMAAQVVRRKIILQSK